MNAMSVTIGDYNADSFFDIYISNTGVGNKFLRNNGDNTFSEVAEDLGVTFNGFAWGAQFLDYDNDKNLDLYVSGADEGRHAVKSQLFRNLGDDNFSKVVNAAFADDTVRSYSNAIGDINNDGYPDIAVNNTSPYFSDLWLSSGGENNWIKIALEGKSNNRDGIGTTIEVYSGNEKMNRYTHCGIGFLGQNSATEMIGLGSSDKIDSIYVKWLNGLVDKLYDVDVNQKLFVFEGSTHLPASIFVNGQSCIINNKGVELFAGHYQSYDWSNGESTASILVDVPGDYFVEVTDINGVKSYSDTITIRSDDFEAPIFDVEHIKCFGYDNGQINVEISDGFEIIWKDFGLKSNELTNLQPGKYNYAVQIGQDCYIDGFVEVVEPEAISIDFQILARNSGNELLIHTSGGSPPYGFEWVAVDFPNESNLTNVPAGDYLLKVSDNNNCRGYFDIHVPTISSLDKETNDEDYIIYPNPVNDWVHIESSITKGPHHVKVRDLTGHLVKSLTLYIEKAKINLEDVPSGLYLIEIHHQQKNRTSTHFKTFLLKK